MTDRRFAALVVERRRAARAVDAAEAHPGAVGRHLRGLVALGVVERDHVLALLRAVRARERVDARRGPGEPVLLGAVAQRRMVLGELRERGDRRVERVRRVEVLDRRRRVGADQVVVVVARDLAGEHVLARVLVAAVVAGEALLVAVVDDRVAAREVHQLVREPVAGEQLGIGGPAVGLLDEVADAAHVVVAEERRQLVGVGVGVRVPVVVGEERLQLVGGARAGRELLGGRLEREVEHGLRLVRAS